MTDLPDANVWLALVDENHPHHERAVTWWQDQSLGQIAFCRVTSLAFLRLSTHPKVLSRQLTNHEAWAIYQNYRTEAKVGFVDDSPEVDAGFLALSTRKDFIHRLWTDCYLAALARHRNCRVVTFDKDFSRFPDLALIHLAP